MTMCFAIFSIYTYEQSRRTLDKEIILTHTQNLNNIGDYLDTYIEDAKYSVATLIVNDQIRMLLSSTSDFAKEQFEESIQNLLLTMRYSDKSIENVYLYSEKSDLIYTSNSIIKRSAFQDSYWLDKLNPDKNGVSIFPYSKSNAFPHTICVAQETYIANTRCVISILLNLSNLPILNSETYKGQDLYIIDDTGNIIYNKNRDLFLKSYSSVELLNSFEQTSSDKANIYYKNKTPYSLVQVHSADYAWTYVLYTPLLDYDNNLSFIQAVTVALCFTLILFAAIMSLLFTLRYSRPIVELRKMLETSSIIDEKYSSEDIQYIANKITQGVQTNQQLSDELTKRFHALQDTKLQALQFQINPHFLFNSLAMLNNMAVDTLGFEHEMPLFTQKIIKLLRYSLEPGYMVSMATELKYTDIYLDILKRRQHREITIIKNVAEDTLTASVPRLIIQPLLENIIFHAFSDSKSDTYTITIRCYFENNEIKEKIVLEIIDNGSGMDTKTIHKLQQSIANASEYTGKHIGLKNVAQRLELCYPNESFIDITSTKGYGSCFKLSFSYIEHINKPL